MKIEYHQPYTCEIWDLSTETDLSSHSTLLDWSNLFLGKHIHELLEILNQKILNIFHNFISNKTIFRGDRDPPWMNEKIKSLI